MRRRRVRLTLLNRVPRIKYRECSLRGSRQQLILPGHPGDLAARVEAELRCIVDSRDMPLYRMMSYHMGWRDQQGRSETSPVGARTHGVACLLACRAAGGDVDDALPVAAAVELVDNFC